VDPEVFFPLGHGDPGEARAICRLCPLREACLDYALAWDVHGIWGGTTYAERQAIRRSDGVAALPVLITVEWGDDKPGLKPGPKPGPKASAQALPAVTEPEVPAPTDLHDPSPQGETMFSTEPDNVPESVDELLTAARALDDRKVNAALEKAETALDRLREVYGETAARIALERAAEEARSAALAEVDRLRAALAEAEKKAAEAGAKLRKTPARKTPSASGGPSSRDVRDWAKRQGIDVPDRGRIPGPVLAKYEAAHRAVAA
jgi:WhiB family redox-sensing transcriptional regulator